MAGILLLLAGQSAAATSTLCMFDPPSTAPMPSLEFLGYEEIGPVLVHAREGPRSLPHGSWKVLDFDAPGSQSHFVYVNPGEPTLPDSFTLKGQGKDTRLVMGGRTYMGEFSCGPARSPAANDSSKPEASRGSTGGALTLPLHHP